LLSSDRIDTDLSSLSSQEILKALQPPRKFGTPHQQASVDSTIFYLPAKLLPWQEELITKRAALVKEAIEKEWNGWVEERTKGLAEVQNLRKQAEELAKALPTPEDDGDAKIDSEMKVDEDGAAPAAVQAPEGPSVTAGGDPVQY
jgi:hypothetical protein